MEESKKLLEPEDEQDQQHREDDQEELKRKKELLSKEKQKLAEDLLEKLLAMSWQDRLLPVVTSGTLMCLCWAVGHWGWSGIWILILTGLYLLKTRMWVSRQEARLKMRKQILRERGMLEIGKYGDELPTWVRFPDTERIEWVNQVLLQLWPFISEYASKFMREFIEPQVLAQMPAPFKSFKFLNIDMGDMPCRVSGLKVYTHNVGRDKIIVDLDVAYAGDADFKVKVCGFTGGMNELVLSGKVRCVLQPLLPQPPMIGGISGSFVELPKFDFNLTGMGDFLQLPLLIDAIRSVINAQMANLCVLPNSIVVPLVPNVNITRLYVPVPDGILRVKVVEARNLENKDVSIIARDKSDPYCELQLGSQLFTTRTINNNLNPQFNEYFEAVVDQASGQKLRINLFDEDTTNQDDELGRLAIPLSYVQKSKVVSKWFNLESCRHGELHLKLFWCELSSKPVLPNAPIPYEADWLTADKPVHPVLMMVFVDNVRDLPFPKANVEPSPVLELTVGNVSQRTPVKVRTSNPVYQSKFIFFIKHSELQELTVKALDSSSNKLLGEMSVSMAYIMEQPDMEVFDKVFNLRHGVHSSAVTLTIRIRNIIVPSESSTEKEPVELSHYANASHIERASDTYENNNGNSNGIPNGTSSKTNGDVFAPEPGKKAELDPVNHPESNNQLNTSRFTSLERRPSMNSQTSTYRNDSKINKLLKPKFRKGHRDSTKPAGRLQLGMKYDEDHSKLMVEIISVDDLVPLSSNGSASPYVQVKLMSQKTSTSKAKKRTQTVENSLKPFFDAQLDFDIEWGELYTHKLRFAVKDGLNYGVLSKAPSLGEAEIPLTNFHKTDVITGHWINLEQPA